VVAGGEEHSTLGVQVREAAARLNLGVGEDAFPEQVFFIRSDQYSFVRQGIPAIMSNGGLKSSDPKIQPKEMLLKWLATVYHTPSDDMTQPLDFEAAAKYARFNFLFGYHWRAWRRKKRCRS
jgi:Zn-dependent M28 family amino/carboxypeptidase